MHGSLVELEIDSPALAGNPLGDPARRPLLAWVPPGGAAGLPAVYLLHGFTGSARGWLNVSAFQPTVPERLDDVREALDELGGLLPERRRRLRKAELAHEEIEERRIPEIDPQPPPVEVREGDQKIRERTPLAPEELLPSLRRDDGATSDHVRTARLSGCDRERCRQRLYA